MNIKTIGGLSAAVIIAANSLVGNLEAKDNTVQNPTIAEWNTNSSPSNALEAKIGEIYTPKVDTAIGVGESVKAARLDALRNILEPYGVKVDIKSIVDMFQLKSDSIIVTANGTVKKPRWGKPYCKGGLCEIKLTGEVIPGSDDANTLLRDATNFYKSKKFGPAIDNYESLTQRFPNYERDFAKAMIIRCYVDGPNRDDPDDLENILIGINSNSPYKKIAGKDVASVFFKEGEEWYNDKDPEVSHKKYDIALKSFQKAVEHDPNNADYYNRLGDCHQRLLNFDKAIFYFNKCLEKNPNDGNAYTGLGYSLHETGKKEEAKKAWEKGVSLGDEGSKRNLEWLSKNNQP